MKTIFFTLSLFVVTIVSSQTISDDFKTALKMDDATIFTSLLNENNINTCFETGNSKYTLLALTIKLKSNNCFTVLLDKKANLEKNCSSKTPLMYAVKYGNLEMVKALTKAGANVKTENHKGRTALGYAIKYEQKEIQAYLESL